MVRVLTLFPSIVSNTAQMLMSEGTWALQVTVAIRLVHWQSLRIPYWSILTGKYNTAEPHLRLERAPLRLQLHHDMLTVGVTQIVWPRCATILRFR